MATDLSASLSSISASMSRCTEMLQQMNDILDRMNGVSSVTSSSSTPSATSAPTMTTMTPAAPPTTATSSAAPTAALPTPIASSAASTTTSGTTVSTPPTTVVAISFRLPTPSYLAPTKKITKKAVTERHATAAGRTFVRAPAAVIAAGQPSVAVRRLHRPHRRACFRPRGRGSGSPRPQVRPRRACLRRHRPRLHRARTAASVSANTKLSQVPVITMAASSTTSTSRTSSSSTDTSHVVDNAAINSPSTEEDPAVAMTTRCSTTFLGSDTDMLVSWSSITTISTYAHQVLQVTLPSYCPFSVNDGKCYDSVMLWQPPLNHHQLCSIAPSVFDRGKYRNSKLTMTATQCRPPPQAHTSVFMWGVHSFALLIELKSWRNWHERQNDLKVALSWAHCIEWWTHIIWWFYMIVWQERMDGSLIFRTMISSLLHNIHILSVGNTVLQPCFEQAQLTAEFLLGESPQLVLNMGLILYMTPHMLNKCIYSEPCKNLLHGTMRKVQWKPPWTSLAYIDNNSGTTVCNLKIRTPLVIHLFWWPYVHTSQGYMVEKFQELLKVKLMLMSEFDMELSFEHMFLFLDRYLGQEECDGRQSVPFCPHSSIVMLFQFSCSLHNFLVWSLLCALACALQQGAIDYHVNLKPSGKWVIICVVVCWQQELCFIQRVTENVQYKLITDFRWQWCRHPPGCTIIDPCTMSWFIDEVLINGWEVQRTLEIYGTLSLEMTSTEQMGGAVTRAPLWIGLNQDENSVSVGSTRKCYGYSVAMIQQLSKAKHFYRRNELHCNVNSKDLTQLSWDPGGINKGGLRASRDLSGGECHILNMGWAIVHGLKVALGFVSCTYASQQ